MANITTVTLTSGLGTAGTGTISTLDNLIGTAGTPNTNPLTVQGISGGTAIPTSSTDGANATIGTTTGAAVISDLAGTLQQYLRGLIVLMKAPLFVATQNVAAPVDAVLTGAQFNTTPTTLTTGHVSPLQMDNAGNLLVNIKAGAGSGGTALADEAAFTEGTTSITPIGGVFQTSHTSLTTGQAGVLALSAGRHALTDNFDGTGNALTSTSGALDVNVKSGGNPNAPQALAQSSSVALSTGSAAVSMAVNPTVTASSTYSAGNEVGGLMTFTGIGRDPNSSGVVQDVTILSKTVQTGEFDLYIFNSNPTASTWADKTAPGITGADKLALIGVVKMTKNYSGLGTHTMYKPDETTFAPIPFSGANLYGVLITPGVPSAQFGTTSDLSVILGVI